MSRLASYGPLGRDNRTAIGLLPQKVHELLCASKINASTYPHFMDGVEAALFTYEI